MSHPSDRPTNEQSGYYAAPSSSAAGSTEPTVKPQSINPASRATEPSRLAVPAVTHTEAYANFVEKEEARRTEQNPQNGVSDAANPESQSPTAGRQGRGRF